MAGVAIATSAAVLTACAPSSGSDDSSSAGTGKKTTLSLVAYSVPKAADGAIEKAFAKTDPGKGVTWKQSYGASGDQSRAVVGGLKADVVHFSLGPDVTRLVDEGLVDKSWDQNDQQGHPVDLGRRDRRAQGQPQAHRVVRRPRQARRRHRDPQPGLLGLGALEHPRGVPVGHRERRQRGRRQGVPQEAVRQRQGAARQRPRRDDRVPGRHRRRAAVVRERGDLRAAERRGRRLRRARSRTC